MVVLYSSSTSLLNRDGMSGENRDVTGLFQVQPHQHKIEEGNNPASTGT